MYKHYLLLIAVVIFYLPLNAQCPSGSISFNSQAEVDAFVALYPNCTTIEGELRIGHLFIDTDIDDISELINLTTVEGSLYISSNPSLSTLTGLENLVSVDKLYIQRNSSLTSIAAVQHIDPSSFNFLQISRNPMLSTCEVDNVCAYLSNCGNSAVITLNGSGCANRLEVKSICQSPASVTLSEPMGLPIDFDDGSIDDFKLSADGNRVSVARTLQNDYGDKEFVINVFEWDGTNWVDLGQSSVLLYGSFDNWFVAKFSPDGNHIAVNAAVQYDWINHYDIHIYEWTGGSNWQVIGQNFPGSGTQLSLSANASRLASASDRYDQHEGTAIVFERNGNGFTQIGQDFVGEHLWASLRRAILSPDGSRLAIDVHDYDGPPSTGGRLRLYEWGGTQWEPMAYDDPNLPQAVFHSFDGSGDHIICSLGNERKYYTWNGSSWELTSVIDGMATGLGRWEFAADGNQLFTNMGSRMLYWDGLDWSESKAEVFPYCELSGNKTSLSGDGNRIAIQQSNSVIIYALEPDVFNYQFPSVCLDSDARTFEQAVSIGGGTFSGPGVSLGATSESFVFDPALAGLGTHAISYTLGGDTYTDSITVITPVAPSLALPDTLWLDAPGLRHIPGTGMPEGGVYEDEELFLIDDDNGQTFSLALLPRVANTVITYTVEDQNGCTVSVSQMVTLINESPNEGGPQINQIDEDILGENAGGKFGFSVSLSADGSRLAVGDPDMEQGEVYIYHRAGDEWAHMATLVARYWQNDFGYDIALSGDGNRLIVGDPGAYFWDYYGGYSGGSFQMYEWDGANWTSLGDNYSFYSDRTSEHRGGAVDISYDGSVIAVGTSDESLFNTVLMYHDTGSGLSFSRIDSPHPGFNYFGNEVALSENGSRVVVSEPAHEDDPSSFSNARVFEWNGNDWLQLGQDILQPSWGYQKNASLDITADGNRIAIGSPQAVPGMESGHVQVYDWNGNSWVQVGLNLTGNTADEHFGEKVALSSNGQRLIIGAPNDDVAGYSTGRAVLYEWDGTNWLEITETLFGGDQSQDQFGSAIAASSNAELVAVGAIQENNTYAGGYVRVFAPFDPAFNNNFLPVCESADPIIDLTGGYPFGGTYSGAGVTDNGDGRTFTFNPAVTGAGIVDITYGIAGNILTNEIEVLAPSTATIALSDTIFYNSEMSTPILGTGFPEGGTYTDNQGVISNIGDGLSFNITSLGAVVNTVITYSYQTPNGCTTSASQAVVLFDENDNLLESSPLGGDIVGLSPEDQIGFAVSLSESGSHLAIGAPYAGQSGQAYVYQLEGTEWVPRGAIIQGEELWEGFGCALSISADGTRLLVGIPFLSTSDEGEELLSNLSQIGGFQLYEWDGNNYTSLGENYFFSQGESMDQLGESVGLSADGTTVLIGRPGTTNGSVEMFIDNGAGLDRVLTDNLVGLQDGSRFGEALAISADGSRLVIGEPVQDMPGSLPGQAHIYEWDGDEWEPIGVPITGSSSGDKFGTAVAISSDGEQIAVGAPQGNGNGYVQVYEWNGNAWLPQGGMLFGEEIGMQFGAAISLSPDGSRLLVGAPNSGQAGSQSGWAGLYAWEENEWQFVEGSVQGGDQMNDLFGFSVACSSYGNVLAVGAVQTNSSEAHGYVRTFAGNSPSFQDDFGPFCVDNQTINVQGGAFPSGGVYSGPGVIDNGDGLSFMFSPTIAGPGSALITYHLDTTELTNTIEVLDLPVITFDLPDTLYVTSGMPENIIGGGLPLGGRYESSSGLFSGAEDGTYFNYNGEAVLSTLQTISYTYTNEEGCTSSLSEEVVVIDLNTAAECETPTALSISNISQVTARFAWEQQGDIPSYWEIEIVENGNLPTGTPTQTNIPNPYLFWSGATQNTHYEVYVRSVCEESTSDWAGPLAFTTHPGCGDAFYDLGGPDGDHPSQQFNRWIFCPDNAGEVVSIDFADIDVGPVTELNIRNGNSGGSPMLLFDIVNPVTVTSSAPNGCLTVEFASSSDTTAAGWEAQVNCIPALHCGTLFYDEAGPADNYSGGIDKLWTICPQDADTQVEVQFTEVDIAAGDRLSLVPGSAYPTLNEEYLDIDIQEPGNYVSNYADGCVTVHFVSAEDSPGAAGWSAEINCVPTPECENPRDMVIQEAPATESLELYWYAMHNIYPIEMEVVSLNEPPTGIATVTNIMAMPYQWEIDDIEQGYEFYLRGTCTEDGYTDWIGPYRYQVVGNMTIQDFPGNLQVFPNPSNDRVQIELTLNETGAVQLELLNLFGQKLWEGPEISTSSLSQLLSLADYPSGTYLLRTRVGAQWFVYRLMKID